MLRQRRWLALGAGLLIGIVLGVTATWVVSSTLLALTWPASGGLGKWLMANKDSIAVAGPLISSLGVLVAGAGLLIAGLNFRLAATTASWNSARDCLWHYNDTWNDLLDKRKAADTYLDSLSDRNQSPNGLQNNGALDEVLNFFDNMAFMGNRDHLDDELAWQNYYVEAEDVWERAKPYADWARAKDKDGTLWVDLERWLPRLRKIDHDKRRKYPAPAA